MTKRGRGVDAKGRSVKVERFIMFNIGMAQSPAWRSLSGPAAKLFIELRSSFNGGNNGELFLSYADAARRLHLGKSTVGRAFGELVRKGFIRPVRKGSWYGRKAATWAVTDQPSRSGELATNDWRRWQPTRGEKQNSVPRRHRNGHDGPTTVPIDPDRPASVPGNHQSGVLDGTASVPHLHFTMGGGIRRRSYD